MKYNIHRVLIFFLLVGSVLHSLSLANSDYRVDQEKKTRLILKMYGLYDLVLDIISEVQLEPFLDSNFVPTQENKMVPAYLAGSAAHKEFSKALKAFIHDNALPRVKESIRSTVPAAKNAVMVELQKKLKSTCANDVKELELYELFVKTTWKGVLIDESVNKIAIEMNKVDFNLGTFEQSDFAWKMVISILDKASKNLMNKQNPIKPVPEAAFFLKVLKKFSWRDSVEKNLDQIQNQIDKYETVLYLSLPKSQTAGSYLSLIPAVGVTEMVSSFFSYPDTFQTIEFELNVMKVIREFLKAH